MTVLVGDLAKTFLFWAVFDTVVTTELGGIIFVFVGSPVTRADSFAFTMDDV